LLTPNNQTVTFVFSESIDQAVSSVKPNLGEWTDDTHYKIKLNADSFTDSPQIMFNVKSVRGNNLKASDSGLIIRFFKGKTWFDASTKKEIPGGPRLHYYDNFIFSPDKSSFVANVFLEGSFADEGGGHYGLVLEQNNKPAIILETDYYIAGPNQQFQVYWLDDNHFIYNNSGGVQLYDVANKLRRNLIRQPDPEKGYIYNFTYDPFLKKLHVIWIKYKENEAEPDQLMHSIYDMKSNKPLSEEIYKSESVDEYKYLLSLSMHPVKHGFYWTKVNKGNIITEYIGNNGSKTQAKGKIVGVGELGVYLLDEPLYGSEGYGELKNRKLYFWKPGDAPKQIHIPDNLGYLNAFGQSLSALSNEIANLNYRYELATNKWLPMNKEDIITTVPYQEEQAIYRIG
jgi:hypothetical protein